MIFHERPFEWYKMWEYLEKSHFFSSSQWWRNKKLYMTSYFIFLAFWSHSVLSKVNQHTKSNLMIYNLSILKKIISVVSYCKFHRALENFTKLNHREMSIENVKYFFSAWFSDHDLLLKNNQQWKNFRMINNMTMVRNKLVYLSVMAS